MAQRSISDDEHNYRLQKQIEAALTGAGHSANLERIRGNKTGAAFYEELAQAMAAASNAVMIHRMEQERNNDQLEAAHEHIAAAERIAMTPDLIEETLARR